MNEKRLQKAIVTGASNNTQPLVIGRAYPLYNIGHDTETPFYRPASRPQVRKGTLVVGVCGECWTLDGRYAGSARSGKDTVVQRIVHTFGRGSAHNLDVRRYALADAVKLEAYEWFKAFAFFIRQGFFTTKVGQALNFDEERFNRGFTFPLPDEILTDREKVEWADIYKNGLRPFLQKWGTDYRRAQDPQYWVSRLLERIDRDRPQVALVSDVRFANETAASHVTIKVKRLDYVPEGDLNTLLHVSENELRDFVPDYTITAKSGQVDVLKRDAERVFEQILERFHVQ